MKKLASLTLSLLLVLQLMPVSTVYAEGPSCSMISQQGGTADMVSTCESAVAAGSCAGLSEPAATVCNGVLSYTQQSNGAPDTGNVQADMGGAPDTAMSVDVSSIATSINSEFSTSSQIITTGGESQTSGDLFQVSASTTMGRAEETQTVYSESATPEQVISQAAESGVIADCSSFAEADKDDCYYAAASKTNDPRPCGAITDESYKLGCLQNFGATMENGQVITKDQMEEQAREEISYGEPQSIEECLQFVAKANEAGGVDGKTMSNNDCYFFFAQKNRDSSICNNIVDGSKREGCTMSTNPEEFRDKVGGEGPQTVEECPNYPRFEDSCYMKFANEERNIEYCDRMKDPSMKEDCKSSLGDKFREREDRGEEDHPQGGPDFPSEIPQDLIDVGAGQEFIDMMCYSMKTGIGQFLKTLDVFIEKFTELNSDTELGFSVDLTGVTRLKEVVPVEIEKLCAATPETYAVIIKGINALFSGDDALQNKMESMFQSFQTQMETKMGSFRVQMESVMSDMESLIQPIVDEAQVMVQNGELSQGEVSLYVREQAQLIAEERMGPFQEKMMYIGEKVQTIMGAMQTETQSIMEEEKVAFAEMMATNFEKEKGLMQKVFNYRIAQAKERLEALRAEGYDVTEFEAVIADIEAKYPDLAQMFDDAAAEMRSLKTASWNEIQSAEQEWRMIAEASREELISLWGTKQSELGESMKGQMEERIVKEFLDRAEQMKIDVEAKLAQAEADGEDTTSARAKFNELVAKVEKAKAAYDEGDFEKAVTFLEIAKKKFAELEESWKEVVRGKIVVDFIEKSDNFKEKVERAISVAKERGLDTTGLEELYDKYVSYIDAAETFRLAGDMESAKTNIDGAEETMKLIRAEWDNLRSEAEANE